MLLRSRVCRRVLLCLLLLSWVAGARSAQSVAKGEFVDYEQAISDYKKADYSAVKMSDLVATAYGHLVRPRIDFSRLTDVPERQLTQQFAAVQVAVFYTKDPAIVGELAMIAAELERRHVATVRQRDVTYAAMIAARMMSEANTWQARYPVSPDELAPDLVSTDGAAGRISELLILQGERRMRHTALTLVDGPWVLAVGSPLCHFLRMRRAISRPTRCFAPLSRGT